MAASGGVQDGERIDRVIDAVIGRYGTMAVPLCAALLVVLGAGMAVSPDSYYGSPLYRFLYSGVLGPRPVGIAYLTVGAAALLYPCRFTVVALVATHVGWGLACLYASVAVDGVSPTAWSYPLTVAALLFLSVRARGYDRSTRR